MSCVKQIKLIDNTRLAGRPVHGLAGGTQLKVRPWRWAEQCSVVPVSRHIGALLSTRTPVATSTATVIIRGEGSRTHTGKWASRSDYETDILLVFLLTNIFIKCPLFWNVLYYSTNFCEDDVMHIYFPRCSDNSSCHPVGSFYYWDLGWSLLSPRPQTRHVSNVWQCWTMLRDAAY